MTLSRLLAGTLILLSAGCAHVTGGRARGGDQREDLWRRAHLSLAAENFRGADTLFNRLVLDHPASREGREARFYLGAIRLDPRNPAWSARAATEHLRAYLASGDTVREPVHRRPEAGTLLELASQLTLPGESRIPGLQPDTVVRTRTVPRRVAPAEQTTQLSAEVERLRREVSEREETIRRQNAELTRIRNTLAPGRR